MAGPSALKTRTLYWKLSNNKFLAKSGNELQSTAQARFAANQSLAINQPIGVINDGSLEVHNVNQLTGWAIDPLTPLQSAYVDIWINDQLVETIIANGARQDVIDYYGLSTDGFIQYGFNYIVPTNKRIPNASVWATIHNRTDKLGGSPTTLTPLATTTTVTTSTTTTTSTTSTTTTTVSNTLDAIAGTKPTYTGIIDTANTRQPYPQYLNLSVASFDVTTGLAKFNNSATNIPSNFRVHVNNDRYMTMAQFLNSSFEVYQGIYVVGFTPDLGSPEYSWQANGQPNTFKAYSYIHFS